MIASVFSMLPNVAVSIGAVCVTWFVCRLWYASRYVHKDEVRPLQESQHIMQNQYAILAERIKQTDIQLAQAKARLEEKETENQAALINLVAQETQTAVPTLSNTDIDRLSEKLVASLSTTISPVNESDAARIREQVNLLKQGLKEFKTEMSQKFNISNNQANELSSQLKQLIELNKKLLSENESQSKSFHPEEDEKHEKHFTLASIKKRS